LFNALVAPVLGLLGPWLQYRVFLTGAKTDQERKCIRSHYRKLLGVVLGFAVTLAALCIFGGTLIRTNPVLFASILIGFVMAYVIAAIRLGVWAKHKFQELRDERTALGETAVRQPREYRSSFELLGFPLIHIRFKGSAAQQAPTKAWIAGGDTAFG